MDVKVTNWMVLFFVLILIVAAIIVLGPKGPKVPTTISSVSAMLPGASSNAPELNSITGYINTNNKPITISQYRGKVVLIDFWTYTCINCIRTLPYLEGWYDKYSPNGLVIIGVHTPEFDFEKEYSNVLTAVQKFGIKYPVVQDNNYGTWTAFNNQYWPHIYLIDKNGVIRYDHIGEGDDDQTERQIQILLSELNQSVNSSLVSQNITPAGDLYKIASPEIYLGYQMQRQPIGNSQGLQPDQIVNFTASTSGIIPNVVYFNGSWKVNPDNAELTSETGQIILNYNSKSVNIVSGANSSDITITLDGQNENVTNIGTDALFVSGSNGNQAVAHIDSLRLYNVVNDNDYRQRTVVLDVKGKGFKIYTFTFG